MFVPTTLRRIRSGAAALLLASEAGAKRHGLPPRARVVAMGTAGVEPRIMGIGPVPATEKLSRVPVSRCATSTASNSTRRSPRRRSPSRGLGLPDESGMLNPHGGAIALGHPLGMSGARLAMTAVDAMERLGARRAIATMCIGIGQGITALPERV